jgi:hypothetical protein
MSPSKSNAPDVSGGRVETLELPNGLTLEIWDLSRLLAGDRWLVSLEARIDVPLDPSSLKSILEMEEALSLIEQMIGPTVTYICKQERHFVSQDEKAAVFAEALDTVKKNTLAYLSHPDFAKKLVLSKYRDLKKKNPQLFLQSQGVPC